MEPTSPSVRCRCNAVSRDGDLEIHHLKGLASLATLGVKSEEEWEIFEKILKSFVQIDDVLIRYSQEPGCLQGHGICQFAAEVCEPHSCEKEGHGSRLRLGD